MVHYFADEDKFLKEVFERMEKLKVQSKAEE
jgi:hypothetical protein